MSCAHADRVVRIRFDDVSRRLPDRERGRCASSTTSAYDIRQGEFVSVIGPSGCGKTTMMNMVGGFVQPTRGAVLLDGKPIAGPGPDRGVIFQEYGVFPWLTVRDNIAFGLQPARQPPRTPAKRDEIVERYMALMGLSDFADPARSTSRAACASGWRSRAPTRCSPSSC